MSKELQFALRGAVGERNLDTLLEDKGAIDRIISKYIRQKAADYGIEVNSVGGSLDSILTDLIWMNP